ncbi:hypothetical protein [Streptomyces sp. NPDC048473]|uniref:Gfo/Idh/MocA family protein n=1 Tax=unclassified Streptomyces TaxID=2593676 RepID=UPI003721853E
MIHDLATHDLDLTAWITNTRYTSIAARTAHRSGRPHEDLLAALGGAALGQLTDGTITHHQVNWVSPLKERTTVVIGDHGILVADTLTADLSYWANGSTHTQWEALAAFRGVTEGDVTRYAIPKQEPLVAEHEAFRDLVLGHSHRNATLHDGLHAVLAVLAAHAASKPHVSAPSQPSHPSSTSVRLDRLARHRRCGSRGVRQQWRQGWIRWPC